MGFNLPRDASKDFPPPLKPCIHSPFSVMLIHEVASSCLNPLSVGPLSDFTIRDSRMGTLQPKNSILLCAHAPQQQMKSASFVNLGLLAGEHLKSMYFLKLLSGVSSAVGTLPCASNFVFAFHSPQSECPQFASGTHISHDILALVFKDVPLWLIWTDCFRKKSQDTFTMALKPLSYPCYLQKEWRC